MDEHRESEVLRLSFQSPNRLLFKHINSAYLLFLAHKLSWKFITIYCTCPSFPHTKHKIAKPIKIKTQPAVP